MQTEQNDESVAGVSPGSDEDLMAKGAAFLNERPEPEDHTVLDPVEEMAYLLMENERLRHLVAGRFKEAAEARLVRAGPDGKGRFSIDIQSTIIPMISEHLAAAFRAQGGENYVEWEIGHPELGPMVLTLQRKWGERPAAVAARERDRADRAEAELAVLRQQVAAGGDAG